MGPLSIVGSRLYPAPIADRLPGERLELRGSDDGVGVELGMTPRQDQYPRPDPGVGCNDDGQGPRHRARRADADALAADSRDILRV